MRDHPQRFDQFGRCRACAADPLGICETCEREAEARAEARHDRTGRR